MGVIWTLARKDLVLVLRDRFGLFWMLGFPLMFALFFGAITGGGGSDRAALPVAVVDEDQTDASRALVKRLDAKTLPAAEGETGPAKPLLKLTTMTRHEAQEAVRKGTVGAYVIIPKGGGEAVPFGPAGTPLEVGYDPRRSAEAGYLQGVLMESVYSGFQDQFTDPKKMKEQMEKAAKDIEASKEMPAAQKAVLKSFLKSITDFAGDIDPKVMKEGGPARSAQIKMEPVSPDRVSPLSAFEVTFPSSILWGLMGCVTTFAISIVLERMQGTLLRLQVAPASWGQILAGKGLACFLACCTVATLLLLVGRLFFGVRIDPARLPLLVLSVGCTAAAFTGLMMFVSTLGKTPPSVAGAGWGLMMPLAMIGGGMIPLIAMPNWLFQLSSISPVKWGILSLEGAIWRNFSLGEMLLPCGILLAVGAVGFMAGAQILSLRETGRGWLPGTGGR